MYDSNKNFALIIGVGGDQIEYTVNDAKMLHKNLTNKDLIGYPEEMLFFERRAGYKTGNPGGLR